MLAEVARYISSGHLLSATSHHNMARVIFCIAFVLVGVALAEEEKYTTKYDNVNVREILENPRLRGKYEECLLADTNEPCTKDGLELKQHIGDALATGCSKCSDTQKEKIEDGIRYIIDNLRETWDKLVKKYDPNGEYTKKYEEEAKSRKINL